MQTKLIYAFILGFVGFVTSFGAHIVAVNLPVYAKEVGIGVALIGVLIAVYDFAEIIAKPVFGFFADNQGMKKTLFAGIGVFILASLLYPWINPHWLIVVRLLQGFGAAALSAVSLALIGLYYSNQRGRAYGIYNAIKGLGYVTSPVLGGYLVLQSHFGSIFIASAVVGVIALFLALFLPSDRNDLKARLDDDDDDFSLQSFLAVFREPKLLQWYGVIVVNMFFVSILFGFLPVRVYALNYGSFETGIILSLVALSYLLVQPVAGWLADKTNIALTITIGLVVSAFSIILLPFVQDAALIAISILSGIGIGIVWTNTDALVSLLAEKGKLGATMGAAGSFKEFGDMIGPIAIGLISEAFGLTIGFVTCGILGLISILLIKQQKQVPPRLP